MTRRQPTDDHEAATGEQQARQPRRTRPPGRILHEIYSVPEDPEADPVFLNAVNEHADVRRFVKHNYGPGDYIIKTKQGGKFKSERELHIEFDGDEVTGAAGVEVEGYETGGPGGSYGEAERIARAVAAALEERDRRAQAAQPDALQLMREMERMAADRAERDRQTRESIRAEVAAMMPKGEQPRREPELTDQQRLELAVLKETGAIPTIFKQLREALGTAEHVDEPETWTDKLLGIAEKVAPAFAPYVAPALGPALGSMIMGRFQQQPAGGLIPPQAPPTAPAGAPSAGVPAAPAEGQQPPQQPPPQQQAAQSFALPPPVAELIDKLAANCAQDSPEGFRLIELSADLVRKFVEVHEDFAPLVAQVMDASPIEIVQAVAFYTPSNALVAKLPHSVVWFSELKLEVLSRDQGDEDEDGAPEVAGLDAAGVMQEGARAS